MKVRILKSDYGFMEGVELPIEVETTIVKSNRVGVSATQLQDAGVIGVQPAQYRLSEFEYDWIFYGDEFEVIEDA